MTAQANAYDAGIMKLSGEEFAKQFFAEENQVVHESGAVVLALKKSDEINTIVEEILLGEFKKQNPSLVVQDRAGYWWLKADGEIVVDCDEASELLGREYRVYDFLVDVSTTIGRAYTLGNVFTITSELMGLDRKLEDVK